MRSPPSPVPPLFRQQSSGEIRNITSVSSSLLPAFGKVMGEGSLKLKRFVIAPYDRRYRIWQTFLVVLVVYSAWSSPFELAFKKVASGGLLPHDLLVDAFFAIDILLTFFVAYLDKTTYLLVDDHKKIAFSQTRHLMCQSQTVVLPSRFIQKKRFSIDLNGLRGSLAVTPPVVGDVSIDT
ncbi:hypothetical protein RND71_016306 [Anisodus tanguticus]|uniref:Ion transport domain-containing protein n=1 Tax=Anisodus tanguticus TaxID=243964 RepID=A0AAE1S732_9SOLA|nr:hypothetical protein RND71_016306 [Anisodus tanguticus]